MDLRCWAGAGEPRGITDPANRPFMESITRGECPAELDPGSRTQQVSVNLVRSEKPYEAPPKPKYKAFSGTGQTLAGELHPAADPRLQFHYCCSLWSQGLPASCVRVPRLAL